MREKPNFRPRVTEAPVLGVEIEFHEDVPGLNGDTVVIYLKSDATFEQAEQLRGMLSDLGRKVVVTSPGS